MLYLLNGISKTWETFYFSSAKFSHIFNCSTPHACWRNFKRNGTCCKRVSPHSMKYNCAFINKNAAPKLKTNKTQILPSPPEDFGESGS